MKQWTIVAAGIGILVLLSSCGNTTTNGAQADEVPDPSSETELGASDGTVTLESDPGREEDGETPAPTSDAEGDRPTTETPREGDTVPAETSDETPRERSQRLNGEAFALYQEGRFEDAAELFKRAIEADEDYYLPRFNYACTVSILIRDNEPEWYYMEDEVLQQLAAVLELNPDYLAKIKTDPDLEVVRKNYRYLELIGITPNTAEGARKVLTSLDWYVPGQGIFPYIGGADFREDGTVELWFNSPSWYETFDDGDRYRVVARYTVEAWSLTITLNEPMLRKRSNTDINQNQDVIDPATTFKGTINADGTLSLEGFEYDFSWTFEKYSA